MSGPTAAWAAVDWGMSNLRVWVIAQDGAVIATLGSDKGMLTLEPDGFEPALLELLAPYLPQTRRRLPVIACGTVGARQGWVEAPYAAAPCVPPGAATAARPAVKDTRLDVRILPGVSQARPSDVIRGEETQIRGFLRDNHEFDGVICLPGTHTKWVHISAGEIVSFRTFMTGEMFALLAQQSVLRHAVSGGAGWDSAAFLEAVDDMMSAPQRFPARLFSLRAGSLLEGVDTTTSRARLSGLLLGLEITGARDYWLGRDVVLIGDPHLTALYRDALAPQGVTALETNAAETTLAGLRAAYAELTA